MLTAGTRHMLVKRDVEAFENTWRTVDRTPLRRSRRC